MKKLSILLSVLLLVTSINAQTVTGKIVDHEGKALSELTLKLYSGNRIYDAITSSDGTFTFNKVTDVKAEEELPTGYNISSNYPNPFNPKTRINITMLLAANVKVDIFNVLGQKVAETIDENFGAGINTVDIELNGLPNGIYLAKFNIDERYSVVRKLMLIYGSNHLSTSAAITNSFSYQSELGLNKTNSATTLDSLVAASPIIGKKVFSNLPNYDGAILNLGSLIIERYCIETPTVTYAGKTYNTIQIGTQCWLKENLDVGTMILVNQEATNNSVIEKYCYNDDPNNCNVYGGLYQWAEALQYKNGATNTNSTNPVFGGNVQGICPSGWHIPSKADFEELRTTVNGNSNSLKAVGQVSGGEEGMNTSGFSALLAGYRYFSSKFNSIGYYTFFWSSTELYNNISYYMYLLYHNSNLILSYNYKSNGFSVRCVKD
jgi:uncharacterized protein (TIGR02145 family)